MYISKKTVSLRGVLLPKILGQTEKMRTFTPCPSNLSFPPFEYPNFTIWISKLNNLVNAQVWNYDKITPFPPHPTSSWKVGTQPHPTPPFTPSSTLFPRIPIAMFSVFFLLLSLPFPTSRQTLQNSHKRQYLRLLLPPCPTCTGTKKRRPHSRLYHRLQTWSLPPSLHGKPTANIM